MIRGKNMGKERFKEPDNFPVMVTASTLEGSFKKTPFPDGFSTDAAAVIGRFKDDYSQGRVAKSDYDAMINWYHELQKARYDYLNDYAKTKLEDAGYEKKNPMREVYQPLINGVKYNLDLGYINEQQAYYLMNRIFSYGYIDANARGDIAIKSAMLWGMHKECEQFANEVSKGEYKHIRAYENPDPLDSRKEVNEIRGMSALFAWGAVNYGVFGKNDLGQKMEMPESTKVGTINYVIEIFEKMLKNNPDGFNIRLEYEQPWTNTKTGEKNTKLVQGIEFNVMTMDADVMRMKKWNLFVKRGKVEWDKENFQESDEYYSKAAEVAVDAKDVERIKEPMAWIQGDTMELSLHLLNAFASADNEFRGEMKKARVLNTSLKRHVNYAIQNDSFVRYPPSLDENAPQSNLERDIMNMIGNAIKNADSEQAKEDLETLKKAVREYIRTEIAMRA